MPGASTHAPADRPLGVSLSVMIPARDEQENIGAAIESVAWADEVIVVDSASTDETAEIAAGLGARVVPFEFELGGPKKKRWALANISFSNPWVLWIDADERVTPELRSAIETAIRSDEADGYCLDREFVFMGRRLRCFQPNWIPRLFQPGRAEFEDLGLDSLPGTGTNEIHEHLLIDGRLGYLEPPLLHRDYKGITQWIDRHNRYATWEAHLHHRLRAEPVGAGPIALLRLDPFRRRRALRRIWVRLPLLSRPPLRFGVWYLARQGFRDGVPGLLFCLLMAWYELLIGIKIGELEDEARAGAIPVTADQT